MNRTTFSIRPLFLLAMVSLCTLPSVALTPVEQADDFFTRGSAEEARGETDAARSCYELALRALPGHREALEKLGALVKKKADDLVALGSAAETKGDLHSANLHYMLALDALPGHLDAEKKAEELKGKMGDAFKEGREIVIEDKLRKIIIPRIDFEDTVLEEALDFLRLRSVELDVATADPAKKGVNFVTRKPRATAGGFEYPRIRELRVRNVPLTVALKYICDQTKTHYVVNEWAVTILPIEDSSEKPAPTASSVSGPTPSPGGAATNPAPASSSTAAPTGPLVWKSNDGRSIQGEYIGLDGDAVVIKRNGREFTIPFTRMDAASVNQAKRMAESVR